MKPIREESLNDYDGAYIYSIPGDSINFSPDGRWAIVMRFRESQVRVWEVPVTDLDIETFRNSKSISIPGKYAFFTRNGKYLYASEVGGSLALYRVNDSSSIFDNFFLERTVSSIESESVAGFPIIHFNENCDLLAFETAGRMIKVIQIGEQKPFLIYDSSSTVLSRILSVIPRNILVIRGGFLEFWTTLGEKITSIAFDSSMKRGFSKDGSTIYLLAGNILKLFNYSGKSLNEIHHDVDIDAFTLSPNGQIGASVSKADDKVHVWDITSGKMIKTFSAKGDDIICFSAIDDIGLSIVEKNIEKYTARILNLQTGSESTALEFEREDYHLFNCDDYQFKDKFAVGLRSKENPLTGGIYETIMIYTTDGRLIGEVSPHRFSLNHSFSPDGEEFVYIDKNQDIQIWNLDSGRAISFSINL